MYSSATRGVHFGALLVGLLERGILSAPAMCGCLRSAFSSRLTSLAAAKLHAAHFFCDAVIERGESREDLNRNYVDSGISVVGVLPKVRLLSVFSNRSLALVILLAKGSVLLRQEHQDVRETGGVGA